MPPDRNLRLGLRWSFDVVQGPAGFWWWAWTAYDSAGNPVLKAERSFETLSECTEDAHEHGYVRPEQR